MCPSIFRRLKYYFYSQFTKKDFSFHSHRLGLDGLLSSDDVVLPVPVVDQRYRGNAGRSLPVQLFGSLLQLRQFLVQLFNLNKEDVGGMFLLKIVLLTCS